MTYPQQIIQEIEQSYQNRDYIRTIHKLEEYLSIPNMGIYKELLNIYIECQIKLGLFDEATKNIEFMYKYFKKTNYYDLSLKYAACCQIDKLKALLSLHTFSPKKYYKIAQYCLNNQNIDLAEELFKLVQTSEIPELVALAQRKLQIIENYKKHKVFQEQTYACFKYHHNHLMPGHIIMISQLRPYYIENTNYQKLNWPYMIWKIEQEKIYAFPVVEKIDPFRYVFSKQNYPGRNDRTLKDSIFCIHEHDVTAVIDKITDEDFENAIQSMALNLIHTQKGVWTPNTNYFMNTYLQDQTYEVGDIIALFNFSPNHVRYYFIYNIDDINYYTYEVSSKYLPYTDDIKTEIISKNIKQTAIIKLPNNPLKNLLLSLAPNTKKRILTQQ